MAVILASASPRRRELMEMLGVKDMKIIPAKGEEHPPAGAGPAETVKALALAKCEEVRAHCAADDVCVAADTIVWFDGHIYGKPHSKEEAAGMLSRLRGNTHEVYTGVAVAAHGRVHVEAEMTRVHFREITDAEIDAYIATGEPMDKAGAYGIQGLGRLLVRVIRGDYFSVVGLPISRLARQIDALLARG